MVQPLSLEDVRDLDASDIFKLKLLEIPAADLLIMSMGAFLGLKGWTPVTALINSFGGQGPTISLPLPQWLIPEFDFFGLFGVRHVVPQGPQPLVQLQDQLAKSFIGAVEAYTITRPGFLQAVGEILPL